MKIFSEIKRVVEQFFETEFFYRWRKITYYNWYEGKLFKTYGRALDHLNNTWDGDTSLLNIVNDKIFHMYVNLRKYGSTLDRHIVAFHILDDGTKEDKYWAFFKALDDETDWEVESNKNTKKVVRELYIGNTESIDEEGIETEYLFCKYTTTNKKTKEITDSYGIKKISKIKTGKTRIAHYLEIDDNDGIKTVEKEEDIKKQRLDNLFLFEEKPKSLDEIKAFIKKVSDKKVSDNDLFFSIQDVSVDIKDYIALSDKLKKHVIGRIPGLHSLWQFRKMINKLYDMSDLDEPYQSRLHKALEGVTDKRDVTDINLQIHQEFLDDKKAYARKIADFYVDHCDSWWD